MLGMVFLMAAVASGTGDEVLFAATQVKGGTRPGG